jgi:hypothetical protein
MVVGGLARLIRGIGMPLVLAAGTALFLLQMHQHYPIGQWLFWRYASYWLCCALLAVASLSAGHAILVRLLRRTLPLAEHFTLAFAVGVLSFALGWFVLGLLHLYSSVTFFVWPVLLAASGAKSMWRFGRRLRRHRRPTSREHTGLVRYLELGLFGLGVIALLLLYAPILTPNNVAYDARWYHLAIAERWAMTGAITRFDEGWFPGATPHLASYLYSWAFSIPKKALFDQVELAAHVEFTLFLATLAGIPPLVRRLARSRGRARVSWVALFAFPGIFLYDSSLLGAADHVAAFFAVPIFLTLLRAWPALDWRWSALFGLMLAGPLLTKYTAVGLVIVPSLAIAFRAVVLLVRALRSGGAAKVPLLAVAVVFVTTLVATAPHWLQNVVYYGNPVYPFASAWFPSRPWTPDTADRFWAFTGPEWSAERSWRGVLATLKAMVTYSFIPNDWPAFHRDVPVFGSLFTLTVPCLLFLKRPWRMASLYAAGHVAILAWYWIFHQDRYLQAFLPWMAAAVAAVAISAWRLGWASRVAVVALGSAQLVWGGDVPFIPGHAMLGGTPLTAVIQLVTSGYRGATTDRFDNYGAFGRVRKLVKPGAIVLIHEEHIQLGVGAATVSDWGPWQGGVSYGQAPAPFEMYDLYRRLGVTHLFWAPQLSRATDSFAGDLAFHLFAHRYAENVTNLGDHLFGEVPAKRPPATDFHDRVLFLDCNPSSYEPGLYRLRDLKVSVLATPRPASDFPKPLEPLTKKSDLSVYASQIDAAVQNSGCFPVTKALSGLGLKQVAHRSGLALWVAHGEGVAP